MLAEFSNFDKRNKEFQRLFFDIDFQLYVGYAMSDLDFVEPVRGLIEFNSRISSNYSTAVRFTRNGFQVGQVDNYLFFREVADTDISRMQLFKTRTADLPHDIQDFLNLLHVSMSTPTPLLIATNRE